MPSSTASVPLLATRYERQRMYIKWLTQIALNASAYRVQLPQLPLEAMQHFVSLDEDGRRGEETHGDPRISDILWEIICRSHLFEEKMGKQVLDIVKSNAFFGGFAENSARYAYSTSIEPYSITGKDTANTIETHAGLLLKFGRNDDLRAFLLEMISPVLRSISYGLVSEQKGR
ncbi:hypothetical protein C8J56DRAFT_507037 [Mycena floridula]|nr:hypothetical protein C8J56DRAFT_507037 [Mycena floridula]